MSDNKRGAPTHPVDIAILENQKLPIPEQLTLQQIADACKVKYGLVGARRRRLRLRGYVVPKPGQTSAHRVKTQEKHEVSSVASLEAEVERIARLKGLDPRSSDAREEIYADIIQSETVSPYRISALKALDDAQARKGERKGLPEPLTAIKRIIRLARVWRSATPEEREKANELALLPVTDWPAPYRNVYQEEMGGPAKEAKRPAQSDFGDASSGSGVGGLGTGSQFRRVDNGPSPKRAGAEQDARILAIADEARGTSSEGRDGLGQHGSVALLDRPTRSEDDHLPGADPQCQ